MNSKIFFDALSRNRFVRWFFLHEEQKDLSSNIALSLSSGSWVLFLSSFVLGHVLGALLLIKQIFTDFSFAVPGAFVDVYLTVAGAFATMNQIDVWFGDEKRKFRKGERVLLFWPFLAALSALIHFFTKGSLPFPSEYGEVLMGISLFFVASKLSAGLKRRKCKNENTCDDLTGKIE